MSIKIDARPKVKPKTINLNLREDLVESVRAYADFKNWKPNQIVEVLLENQISHDAEYQAHLHPELIKSTGRKKANGNGSHS